MLNNDNNKLKIYVVYDEKINAYGNPFYMLNEEVAKDSIFRALKNDEKIKAKKNDIRVYEIGEYNILQGKITSYDNNRLIIDGKAINNGNEKENE